MFQLFEKINELGQEGEPNTINIMVTAEMTRDQVVTEIKNKLKEMEENKKARLLDGYYKANDAFVVSWKVDGDNIDWKDAHDTYDFTPKLKYGDFGDVNDKLAEMIGSKQRYNMMITYQYGLGELDENGEMKVNIKGQRQCFNYVSVHLAYGDQRLWIYF